MNALNRRSILTQVEREEKGGCPQDCGPATDFYANTARDIQYRIRRYRLHYGYRYGYQYEYRYRCSVPTHIHPKAQTRRHIEGKSPGFCS